MKDRWSNRSDVPERHSFFFFFWRLFIPHASSSPLVSEYRAPQGQGPTMLVRSSSPGDAHLVSQGGERASRLPLPPPCLFSLYYRIINIFTSCYLQISKALLERLLLKHHLR